jgi:nucleoside 2-deoxyribosyltransferase
MAHVYISGSLRHTPQEWWSIYEKISDVVKEMGFETFVPHIDCARMLNQKKSDLHNPKLDPSVRANAYRINLEAVKNSKLIIAEVTNTSIGTGIEIGFALQFKKPIICLARNDADVTSMVVGPAHMGLIKLIRYDNEEEALDELKGVLKETLK